MNAQERQENTNYCVNCILKSNFILQEAACSLLSKL